LKGRSTTVPSNFFDEFNKKILQNRKYGLLDLLECEFSAKDVAKQAFVLLENILYFRDGVNGRPDAVMYDRHGQVLAVVEFKGMKSQSLTKDSYIGYKQAAFYQYMLNAKKSYVCYYPAHNAKFSLVIKTPHETYINKIPKEWQNFKSNYQLFNEAAAARLKTKK
jgi:hypothetical protein